MSIDDDTIAGFFTLTDLSVMIASSQILQEALMTILVDIRSEYWEENLVTVTFEFLECEAYYYRSGADVSISTHSHTSDLIFDL